MTLTLPNDWHAILLQNCPIDDMLEHMTLFLSSEQEHYTIYPEQNLIFNALALTSYKAVQVVILGQDPYHGPNQAEGLSFSVQQGVKIPPSLRNIYKELADDLSIPPANTGCLEPWAKQGVLLLNTVLTVRKGAANSHQHKGWEKITDCIISSLNQREDPIIFVLWGKPAQKKAAMIDQTRHFILEAPHPSPLSAYRGFFGSRPFSKINSLLKQQHKKTIVWKLSETVI
ncbi:uracil-DNA glycosylase [Vagococcus vulneris]|uniref:Uracil-DNA glycosylase n=1 Tax=Vagococcus vulneris TaxID=1977869 RepID=A0A430A0F8_9ENTE|nr:uracil-DNA glycosylase [Vagococcus vulneris]RST99781.1 uracil-DNA glycosylase [Vagococcus vulneris]